jgi:hypothetical protein
MAGANKFQIENGVVAWSLVGDGDDPTWQAPGGKQANEVTAADYSGETGLVFSCQVQSCQLTASPNTSDETTDPTFCEPEVTTTQVGVTSYSLELTALQDPHIADGISYFSFKNDTKLAYFALGLKTWGAPKAIGKCRIVAGTFGGGARTDLTTDIACPVETKPDIQFGTDAGWTIVHGDGSADTEGTTAPATGATAGSPGDWTPAGASPPASVADLQAGTPNPVTASPATAWTTGQYVQTGTAGAAGQAYWDGAAWVSGTAALAASTSSTREPAEASA